MKRLISILVLVAMMLTTFAGTLTALADEVAGDDTVVEGDGTTEEGGETEVETEKVYNVNWKELVDKGIMRSTWIGDRGAGQNNMADKYTINATENALKMTKKGGDSRAYFSEIMFDITADTQYELVFKADKTSDNCDDAGVIFAWAATTDMNGHEGKHAKDGTDDIYPGVPKFAYHIMADWGAKNGYMVNLGGPDDKYAEFNTASPKATLTDVAVDEENFATYKVVYNGLQIKLYFLNTTGEWVEFHADKEMVLAGNAVKLTVGLNTWSPSHTNLKDCVITAKNEAAVAAMNAALTADKTAYEAKLAETKAFVEADWLPADWAKFTAKMNEAKAMAADAEYKYELDYAMAKIDAAITTLKITASAIKPAVEKLITEVDAIVAVPENQALYTEASWGRMTAALEAAKTTVANAEAKQSDLVAAYNALLATKKGLLTKELAAKSTYNVNWKYFYENNMMRSQWWWDNSDSQNNYLSLFKVIATETYLGSDPIGEADNRSYYSTMMLDITENTYYEYTFEAKNDRAGGYAGILFAYDTNDFPYFVYGQFDNSSDNGTSADFRYRKGHQDRNSDGHNSKLDNDARHYPVLDLTAEGYGQFKYVYDGYNFSFYAMTEGELKLIWSYTLPAGSKIAYGVYNRGGKMDADPEKDDRRTMSLQNATIVAYNEAAAEIIVNTASATAIKLAEAKLADTYTPATEQAVKDAMAVVKAINAETPATDVDAAIAALQTAILGLKKADKTALIAAIEAANAAIADKTAADFEERYYTPFATALEAAIAANDNVNSTQEDVDAALAELVKTQKYLTLAGAACVVDLNDVLALYATLVETNYKPNSWVTLANPLAVAEALKAREDLTNADQGDIDAAVVALNAAIEALVERANFNALNVAINRANALDKTDYTADSWKIDDVLAAAIAVAADFNNDQPAIDDAAKALNDAINALVTWRTNVLAIVPADDYQVNDTEKYPNPTWYNKITDMSYHGLGNVFYYDYHKVVATTKKNADLWTGFEAGKVFPESLEAMDFQGNANYVLRLGTNMSGSGTNRVTDGEKEGGTDLQHHGNYVNVNGKKYNHAFGFSFLKAPTVDSIAVYLPTDTKIVSIDVYGAVLTKNADGTILYGKADKDAVTEVDGAKYEDGTTAKKIYLGTINVPAAEAGAANILAAADFVQAMKVDYIYFALTMNDTFSNGSLYYIKEIELFGLNDGQTVDGKAAPDFTAVNAAMAAYYNCVEADYTVESWANVQSVIAQYAGVINYIKAEQADVDAAAAALDAAVKALVANPADFTELDAAISAGADITLDKYTPATFNPFKAAYDVAVALKAGTNVPQTAVNKAVAALNAALAVLEKRADTTTLKANLEAAKQLKEEEWNGNKIAWKMFANAIAAAEELLANENATQAEVDKVADDLIARQTDLVKVEAPADPTPAPGDPVDPGDPGDETEKPTEKATGDETEKDTEKATETEKETEEEKKSGCGSSVALSALAIVGVIGTAVVLKKKED